MNKQYRLTAEGIEELKTELDQLKGKRKEVAEAIRVAREQGDLSENAEYQDAKDEQGRVESRITEIEHILQNVEEIDENGNHDKVTLGAKVTLENGDGNPVTYTIVGSVEADPAERKISDESPIGKALFGAKKGDKVDIDLPAGTKTYTVKSIK